MDEKQECVYSNGMWSVIKRVTDEGECFSVVRYGSVFFEHTCRTLAEAINYCDEVM